MQPDIIRKITPNPAWRPLTSEDSLGYLALVIVAAVLVGLTLWTYLGSAQTTPRRLALLIGLRLLALLIAILTTLRPALEETEIPRLPSTLIIVVDASESMTLTDEYDRLSRWEVTRRAMEKAAPIIKQLEAEQQVTIYLYHFADNFNPDVDRYDPNRTPNGPRTDFGTMLYRLYQKHQGDQNLRALLILSDGADNGTEYPALAKVAEWRGINCPIYTFGVGRVDTRTDQKDIGFTLVEADPAPAPVKADISVKARLNAQGLEGATVKVRLLIDDQPVKTEDFRLLKPTGNEIAITTKAPETPGEYKVSLEIQQAPPDDVNADNNRIDTYLTVTKEGVRILVIDRLRLELKYLIQALASDEYKRFDVVQLIRQTDEPITTLDGKKLSLLDGAYDVILLGDVSPQRLKAAFPDGMKQIEELVLKKGVGLLMTAGLDSFGGTIGDAGATGWAGTEVGRLLPVELPRVAQVDQAIKMEPRQDGLKHYLLRLDANTEENKKLWDRLNERSRTQLGGYMPLGRPKPGARVYADAVLAGGGAGNAPLLVGHEVGEKRARVIAFGGDQTWKWVNLGVGENGMDPKEGWKVHARFWRQMMLWLAHQEETEGSVFVSPKLRRLAVNGKNSFRMGVRNKFGSEVANAEMRYQVVAPGQEPDESKAQRVSQRDGDGFLANYEVKKPGEYRVYVWGKAKDVDGTDIVGDKMSRFIVYPEVSDELMRPAANHDFLLGLESAANGFTPDSVRRPEKLASFLEEEVLAKPLEPTGLTTRYYPNWNRDGSPWFLPTLLVLFVLILGLEWGLRRIWGMV